MEKEKRSEDEEPEEKFSPTAGPRGRILRLDGASPRSFSSDLRHFKNSKTPLRGICSGETPKPRLKPHSKVRPMPDWELYPRDNASVCFTKLSPCHSLSFVTTPPAAAAAPLTFAFAAALASAWRLT